MQQTIDAVRLNYIQSNGLHAWCQLRVFEKPGRAPVIVASEIAGNPGPSITDSVTEIAGRVWEMLDRPAVGVILIEHYRAGTNEDRYQPEQFSIVTFQGPGRFENPYWWHLQRLEVEMILGCTCL